MARRWLVFPDGTIVPEFKGGVDDTLLNLGSGGNTLASDDIGGIHFQRIKLIEGADGVNDGDVSSANPLPVELPNTSQVDLTDEAARDCGKIDIVSLDQYTPIAGNLPVDVQVSVLPPDAATQTTLASLLSGQLAAGHAVDPSGVTSPVSIAATVVVEGAKTSDAAAPGATNVGTLPAVANAAAPSHTEARQVALRTTIAGDLAVTLDGETVDVTGTVTANAGTDLNTSLLALEAGGNLAAIASGQLAAGHTVDVTDRAGRDLGGVDILAALPAGAARIGKVTIRDSADSADIDPIADGGNVVIQSNASVDVAQALGSALSVSNPIFVRIGDGTVNIPFPTALVGARFSVDVGASALPSGAATSGGQLAAGHTVAQAAAPWEIDGDVAAQASESGNPIKIGGRAHEHGADPPASVADERVEAIYNRHGIPFSIGGHPNVQTRRDTFSTAQTDQALVTVGAGSKIVVTRVLVTASNGNTVDPSVIIGFGTSATPTTAGVVAAHDGIPKGGGLNTGDGSGILGVGADNEDLRLTSTTTGTISIVVSYFTIPS